MMIAISCKTDHKDRPCHWSKGLLVSVAGAAMLAALPLSTASATELGAGSSYLLSDLRPLSDGELAHYRGGFKWGRFDISFGYQVSTSIQGPRFKPILVTSNFKVERPGYVVNLGTDVNTNAAVSGPANAQNKFTLHVPNGGQSYSNPISSPTPTPKSQTVSSPPGNPSSDPIADVIATVDGSAASISISPPGGGGPGASVHVDTGNGVVTTIKNTLSQASFTTSVDLNYVIENYQQIVADSKKFHQASNLAHQAFALHGLSMH